MLSSTLPAAAVADEISWIAIRQPAVIRMLERHLPAPDGDALAACLELVCRLVAAIGRQDGVAVPTLPHRLLDHSLARVTVRPLDVAIAQWVQQQLPTLAVMLSPDEEMAVSLLVAAVADAAARVHCPQLADDELVT